jgi:hypothetical protein
MARKYEQLTAAIGNTVIGFAQIESMMGTLIAFQYTSHEKFSTFIADVLADESFSYGLRCNAVRKVLVRNGLTEKKASATVQPLRDLGGTRNLIAHMGKIGFAGQGAGYLHPKKVGEVINADDLEELCKRFDVEYAAAFEMLKEWLDKVSPYKREFLRLEAEVNARKSNDPKPEQLGPCSPWSGSSRPKESKVRPRCARSDQGSEIDLSPDAAAPGGTLAG